MAKNEGLKAKFKFVLQLVLKSLLLTGAFDDKLSFRMKLSWKIQISSRIFLWYTRHIFIERLWCCFSYFDNLMLIFHCNIYFSSGSSDIFAGSSCST